MHLMHCIDLINLFMKEGDGMSKKSNNKTLFFPTDDTIDIGKEPLPINDAEIEKLMNRSIERLNKK